MSYHAPKMESLPQKPEPPLINMEGVGQAIRTEKNKRGYLSTFLSGGGSTVKQNGFLSSSLGKSNI